jgi:O-antigen ligase
MRMDSTADWVHDHPWTFGRFTRSLLALALGVAILVHSGAPALGMAAGFIAPFHAVAMALGIVAGVHVLLLRSAVFAISRVEAMLVLFTCGVLVSYGVVAAVSIRGAVPIKIVIAGMASLGVCILGLRLFADMTCSRRHLCLFLRVIFDACALNAMVNVVAWLVATGGVIGRYNFEPPLVGSQGMSSFLSTFGFVLGLAYGRLCPRVRSSSRFWWLAKLATLACGVVIVVTRQGQLSFVITVGLFAVFASSGRGRWDLRAIVLAASIAVVACIGLWKYAPGVIESYRGLLIWDGEDVLGRLAIIGAAMDVFQDNLGFGIGYGNFGMSQQILFFVNGLPRQLASAHNGVATLAAEGGILGLSTFFALVVFVVVRLARLWRGLRRHDAGLQAFVSALLALLLVELASMVTGNAMLLPVPTEPIYVQMGFLLWSLVGMAEAVGRHGDRFLYRAGLDNGNGAPHA